MPLSFIEAASSCLFISPSGVFILKALKTLSDLAVLNKQLIVIELVSLAHTSVYQAVRLL